MKHAWLPALALLASCTRDSAPSGGAVEDEEEAPAGDAPHALPVGEPVRAPHGALPPGHPGAGSDAPAADGPALQWTAPAEWRTVTPSSSMRRAEWALPKQGSDPEDASLVVFYFGQGQGGGIEQNLDRWYGQFTQPDGRATRALARTATRTVAGMRVTVTDVSGTFAGGMPMGPAGPPKTGWRMLAAIVESPSGPWFFKLTGPTATVEHWKASFETFVSSIHAAE